jgi:hypothetical protein
VRGREAVRPAEARGQRQTEPIALPGSAVGQLPGWRPQVTGVLREHGATLAQHAVLTALDEEPGLSNAGLARRAFVTPQTMNQVPQELEQKR